MKKSMSRMAFGLLLFLLMGTVMYAQDVDSVEAFSDTTMSVIPNAVYVDSLTVSSPRMNFHFSLGPGSAFDVFDHLGDAGDIPFSFGVLSTLVGILGGLPFLFLILVILVPVLLVVLVLYLLFKKNTDRQRQDAAMLSGQEQADDGRLLERDRLYAKGVRNVLLGIGLMFLLGWMFGKIGVGVGIVVICIGLGDLWTVRTFDRRRKSQK